VADQTAPLVENFFRHEYGRLVATLTRRYGVTWLDQVEEAVQTALLRAVSSWSRQGAPHNPAAWLTRAAHNALLDEMRRTRTSLQASQAIAADDAQWSAPEGAFDGSLGDDELHMLFVCCDEALPEQHRMVLALKLLCGFSVDEIAHRLFLSEANVFKVVTRAKSSLAERWGPGGVLPTELSGEQICARLQTVQRVIYLLFNEGYSSQQRDQLIRKELCVEALRLAQFLVAHATAGQASSWALLALMHFHSARLDARMDSSGGLLLLEEQDRKLWDRHHIDLGLYALTRSACGEEFSRYHAEAAILAEHCLAPSFEDTRWSEICELYAMLERVEPSPLITLNRAVALAQWRGPEAGLDLLRTSAPPAWLARFYLWDAVIGELLRRAGRIHEAIEHLERALERAPTDAEHGIILRRLWLAEAQTAAR
jgi:RNA polymerase sigma factor (sigma-70 family)